MNQTTTKSKPITAVKPKPLGWNTTDQDEIALRRWRGETEPMKVQALETKPPFFGTFSVQSTQQQNYCVEIRHSSELFNSCDCPDYQHNGLGICKHIEKVLWQLRRRRQTSWRQAQAMGSERIEIFLDNRESQSGVRILWPRSLTKRSSLKNLLTHFFADNGRLLEDPLIAWPKLRQCLSGIKTVLRKKIRISNQVELFFQECQRRQQKHQFKTALLREIQQNPQRLDVVKLPLYPYQREGILHLALNERALLGDEMGLGKTIQAIAACELLRQTQGIQRVLVVTTASLKSEWEEQIQKFVDLPYQIIIGDRAHRLQQYQQPCFFSLTNYEQVITDAADIQSLIKPDVIILDEAQRIKNWQTRTAYAIKKMHSRYAFVLTGTPLENRIDDIYSITQFFDPTLFGPLFRFNRDFYQLNDKGKPVAYKNLDQLYLRLCPILLRRRKSDVEKELPPCTLKNIFVGMTEEQTLRYETQEKYVSRLAKIAERRPLSPEEFKKLQLHLSCMRMLCDTPYILDNNCRDCPKLIELENVLTELLMSPQNKIIIFSEWVKMLQLVRELAQIMGFGAAWHTGSVPQSKRRQEINRFKQDPHCRLFLSSDSGSVGLNLQAANVVINLDLPWNPAKLAQRIARAWRKHQSRHVQVINLVTEHSIEHRMLHILNKKESLAQSVLHGDNDLREMKLPSGREAFLERMAALLQKPLAATKQAQPALLAPLPGAVDYLAACETNPAQPVILAVSGSDSPALRKQIQSVLNAQYPKQTPTLEVLDRQTFIIIQRLAQAGLLSLHPQLRALHGDASAITTDLPVVSEHELAHARQQLQKADRPLRLAGLLFTSGFYEEALAPWCEAVECLLIAAAWQQGLGDLIENSSLSTEQIQQLITQRALPAETLPLSIFLRKKQLNIDEIHLKDFWQDTQKLIKSVSLRLGLVQEASIRMLASVAE